MKSWCFLIGLLAFLIVIAQAQRRPPNYSQDDMPDTNFDCRDKILGGYYADLETDCQMFHVCVKVPGLGVQDFRFLCPNDTAFDQENQICANWFDIDCEAGTLFYSDNFDLYRIGQGPSKAPSFASSVTPIPLGPSTARPPLLPSAAPRQRTRNQYRQPDDEEDYFLQRSETGDRRLQQKDLRGSSSGNFFNKNKGKEDDYETDVYQSRKPTKSSTTTNTITQNATEDPSHGGKKKVAVRKLRKRPQQQNYFNANQYDNNKLDSAVSTTAKSTTTYSQQNYREQQNNNNNYYNTGSTAAPLNYDAQSGSKTNQNSNYYTSASTQAPISYESPSTLNRNYYQSSTASPSTTSKNNYTPRYNTIQRTSSTYAPSTAVNYNQQSTNYQNYNQQKNYQQNNQEAKYENYDTQQTKYNNQQATNYENNNKNNFYNTNNNFAQKSTTLNAIEYSSTSAPSSKAEAYKNYQTPQRKDYPSSTTYAPAYSQQKNNYNNPGTAAISTNNYQTTANYKSNQKNSFDNYSSSNQRGNTNYDYTTVQPDRYNLNEGTDYNTNNNNNNNQNNFYSSKFANSAYQSTTIKPTTYNNNNYKQTSSEEYNNYYKNENYDYRRTPANSQVNANSNYQDESDRTQGESLKTAPSNNYRPNSFNTFQTTYDKKDNSNSYYNNTNNNYYSNVTPKASTYSSVAANNAQYSSKQTTTKNNYDTFSQTTSTPYKSSPSSTYYYTSTTKRPQVAQTINKNQSTASKSTSTTNYQQPIYKAVTATFVPASDVSKTAGNKRPATVTKTLTTDPKDTSYDYAYYDDAFVEYDGVDPIKDHHFGKTKEAQKIPRSTKQ